MMKSGLVVTVVAALALSPTEAAYETPAPSLICLDAPTREVLEPTPSHSPSPLHFLRAPSTRSPTIKKVGPTMHPTNDGECPGMLDSLSLLDKDGNEVIPLLRNWNYINMLDYPEGFTIQANAEAAEGIDAVRFTVNDGDAVFYDPNAPFSTGFGDDISAALSPLGIHTLEVKPIGLNHVGCFWDLTGPKIMYAQLTGTSGHGWNAMRCRQECKDAGFGASGMQNGGQCWCGDADLVAGALTGSYPRDQERCNRPCIADETQFCGGSSRLIDVYYTEDKPMGEACTIHFNTLYDNPDSEVCDGSMIPSLTLVHGHYNTEVGITPSDIIQPLELTNRINMAEYPHGVTVVANANAKFTQGVKYTVDSDEYYSYTDVKHPFIANSAIIRPLGRYGFHTVEVQAIDLNYDGCFRANANGWIFKKHLANRHRKWGAYKCRVECGRNGYAFSGSYNGADCFCGTEEDYALALENDYARSDGYCTRACTYAPHEVCGAHGYFSVYNTTDVPVGEACTVDIETYYHTPGAICEDSMTPTLKLVKADFDADEGVTESDIIGPLDDENVINMADYPMGVMLMATSNPATTQGVSFSVGDWYTDSEGDYPFKSTRRAKTAFVAPGTTEVVAQSIDMNYFGCFQYDRSVFRTRIASHNQNWSPFKCRSECKERGFDFSASRYYAECRCDNMNNFVKLLDQQVSENMCYMRCRSDASLFCGSHNQLSVYNTTDLPMGPECSVKVTTVYNYPGSSCSESMISKISLIKADYDREAGVTLDDVVVDDLAASGSEINMFDYPAGLTVMAHTNEVLTKFVGFSIDGELFTLTDPSAPFIAGDKAIKALARPGLHEIVVEAVDPNYIGCFIDRLDGRRFRRRLAPSHWRWDGEKCRVKCAQYGYPVGGPQNRGECWCGTWNEFHALMQSDYERPIGACRSKCRYDDTKYCGGSNHISVYNTTDIPMGPSCKAEMTTVYEKEGSTCEGMFPSISLVDAESRELITDLGAGTNEINMHQYPDGVVVRANAYGNLTDAVRFYIDDDYTFLDLNEAFIGSGSDFPLALPGTHTIKAQAIGLNYFGCIKDMGRHNAERLFQRHLGHRSWKWSASRCRKECGKRGYAFAGSNNGAECRCGRESEVSEGLENGLLLPNERCYMNCAGDNKQKCGAYLINSVYNTSDEIISPMCELELRSFYDVDDEICGGMSPTLSLLHRVTGEVITDLESGVPNIIDMSNLVEGVEIRANANEKYTPSVRFTVGSQYNFLDLTPPFIADGIAEVLAFPGNHSVKVQVVGHNYVGCFKDYIGRKYHFRTRIAGSREKWSATKCRKKCGERGYAFSGSVHGHDCYCGTNKEFLAAKGNETGEGMCDRACTGDETEKCGGRYYLSVYNTSDEIFSPACRIDIKTVYAYEDIDNKCEGMLPSLTLVNARTGEEIVELENSYELDMAMNSDGVKIVANANNANFTPGVRFIIEGTNYTHLDTDAPFIGGGGIQEVLALPGVHKVEVAAVGYTFVGCYRGYDYSTRKRMFTTRLWRNRDDTTMVKCRSACARHGFEYAAGMYRKECWCGTEEQFIAGDEAGYRTKNGQCNYLCEGDKSENCGGDSHRMSVYSTADKEISEGCSHEITTLYKTDGQCAGMIPSVSLIDATTGEVIISNLDATSSFNAADYPRGVTLRANPATNLTPGVRFMVDDEYSRLTTRYPFEAFGLSPVLAKPGSHSVTIEAVGLNYIGCFKVHVDRVRLFQRRIAHTSQGWDALKCRTRCGFQGYAYSGSYRGGECWCGTVGEIASGFADDYMTGEARCSYNCTGDASLKCGGRDQFSVYATADVSVSPTCSFSLNTLYDNEAHECPGMIPSMALINAGTDEVITDALHQEGNIVRIEDYPDGITVKANTKFAPAVRFSIAGNDNYDIDSSYPFALGGVEEYNDAEGGWNYLSSPYLALPGTHEIQVRSVDLNYIGCFEDLINGRMFPRRIAHWNWGWNALKCRTQCGRQGFEFAGSQNGGECYCGNAEHMALAISSGYDRDDSQCNRKCREDDSQYCGGSRRNSVYNTTDVPLSDWCSTEITVVHDDPPVCPGLISELILVDAGTKEEIQKMTDGMVITLSDTSGMLTVRATVEGRLKRAVEAVRFVLDDVTKEDPTSPYYLNYDFSGGTKFDPEPRMTLPGEHTLTVYAKTKDLEYEKEARHCTIHFTVVAEDDGPCDGIIQSLSLINAESNGLIKPILGLEEELDIANYQAGITVRANVIAPGYQPIVFSAINVNEQFDYTSYYFPHALSEVVIAGDQNYNYSGSEVLTIPGETIIRAGAVMVDYKGCYRDRRERVFEFYADGHFDVAECIQECRYHDYPYAGMQNRRHCYCGTEEDFASAERVIDTDCNRPCNRNSRLKCGGSYRNSVYGTNESSITGDWCEVKLTTTHGDGEGACSGAVNSFSIMVVGGGSRQTLQGFGHMLGDEYYTMDMTLYPFSLTLRANIVEEVSEIHFYVNDTKVMVERVRPFVIGGKANFTDFLYKAPLFSTIGAHKVKAIAVDNLGALEDPEKACELTIEVTNLPDIPEDPEVPIYDPKTPIDFLLIAEQRCKPVYVDGTAEGGGFFFKTLGEITNTTLDDSTTFKTLNYFTMEDGVGNIDYITTVYQDAETGEIVCDMATDVATGDSSGEYVGKCDTGNFTYFEIYAFDEGFDEFDDANYDDLVAECKPPPGATIGGARKFTFAVPCDCTSLDDEHDYGDEVPRGSLVAASWGDPHLITWDGTKYDCQGVGEFTLFKASLLDYEWHFGNTDYETHNVQLQMRYEFMDAFFIKNRLVSFGKGFVVKEKRTVQAVMADDPVGKPKVGSCPIDFYVDGERFDFTQGLDDEDLIIHPTGSNIFVFFPKTGVLVQGHVRWVRQGTVENLRLTCSFSVFGGMPMNNPSIYNVVGLWGTPDGQSSNDFVDQEGNDLGRPGNHRSQYEFCTTHWCVRNETDSLFTYEEGTSHSDFMLCDTYNWKGDVDYTDLDPQIEYICNQLGDSVDIETCKFDGLMSGLDQTLQAFLDITEFNGMATGTTQGVGDSDTACCSSNFKTCHEGPQCNNFFTCEACVGKVNPMSEISPTKPWAWLREGDLEGTCAPLGAPCGEIDGEVIACCSNARTECSPVDGVCEMRFGNERNRIRRRLEFSGFNGVIVPKSSRHAEPYFRPMFT